FCAAEFRRRPIGTSGSARRTGAREPRTGAVAWACPIMAAAKAIRPGAMAADRSAGPTAVLVGVRAADRAVAAALVAAGVVGRQVAGSRGRGLDQAAIDARAGSRRAAGSSGETGVKELPSGRTRGQQSGRLFRLD